VARLRTRLFLLTILAGGSTNCLLDTGPINMPPTVQIDEPSQSLRRGGTVTFTATIHDPDQSNDTLTVAWHVGADCDKATASAPMCQGKDQCSYMPSDLGSVCVVVKVTDRYGATAVASRVFAVADQPPTAVIEQTSPAATAATLPLSSTLTFSALGSTDPDPGDGNTLTFAWTVTQPDGTSLSVNTCPSPQTPAICSFTSAMPGSYHVQLIATDASGMASAPASVDIVIAQDQPPCIVGFTPTALQTIGFADQDTTFAVTSVNDDVDPYPGSTLGTFTWWYRMGTSGGFIRLSNPYSSNQLDFGPDAFSTGDEVQVRVEYQDRINRSFSTCDQNALRCELVPGCAQWVTWTVQFL
jgi:hypothetical protein